MIIVYWEGDEQRTHGQIALPIYEIDIYCITLFQSRRGTQEQNLTEKRYESCSIYLATLQ